MEDGWLKQKNARRAEFESGVYPKVEVDKLAVWMHVENRRERV